MAHCAPIVGNTNPSYLRNRPTSWLNGFVIVEFHKAGNFNCYPVVVSDGRFSYGGEGYSESDLMKNTADEKTCFFFKLLRLQKKRKKQLNNGVGGLRK